MFEAVWMACPHNSAEKLYVQSVIQHANAALKNEMGQSSAAARIEEHARDLMREARIRTGGGLFGQSDFMQYNAKFTQE